MPSETATALSTRLWAVQALYQSQQNNQPIRSVADEYVQHRSEMVVDGEVLVPPDPVNLKKLLFGVDGRLEELEDIVGANLKKDASDRQVEPLLRAIMICGCYEIMLQDIDIPIIINDYLNVGHAFYERNEVALINGVLDSVAAIFREESSL
jgi:N utilization substance protein B